MKRDLGNCHKGISSYKISSIQQPKSVSNNNNILKEYFLPELERNCIHSIELCQPTGLMIYLGQQQRKERDNRDISHFICEFNSFLDTASVLTNQPWEYKAEG